MDYMLKRWTALTRFLDDCRICLSNKAADRALGGGCPGQEVMVVRRLRSRWAARRASGQPDRCAPPMELAAALGAAQPSA